MHKSLLLFSILFSILISTGALGQFNQRMDNKQIQASVKNEFRFNMLSSMLGLLELNYERFLSDNSGLGISTSISLESREDQTIRSMALPYFRVYFDNRYASGAFIEANMAIAREYFLDYGSYVAGSGWINRSYKYQTTFGLGTSIGYKMVRRNGLVGEVSLGLGRLFGNSYAELYPRIGISIGKRW